jgi:endonuclease-3
VRAILQVLDSEYGASSCALDHKNAYELLIATILSAQCTDARVNIVTRTLFEVAPDPRTLAGMPEERIEELVHSTGFFRNKARSLKGCATRLVEEFGGRVPKTMDELLTLPGVARKTANVVLGTWFGIADGIVVDTHVTRISRLLKLTRETDAKRIEKDLMAVVPREHWIRLSHQLIEHGRKVCIARRPRCAACAVAPHCPSSKA